MENVKAIKIPETKYKSTFDVIINASKLSVNHKRKK